MLVRCTDDFPSEGRVRLGEKKVRRKSLPDHLLGERHESGNSRLPCSRRTEIDGGGNSRYMGRGSTADTRKVHEAERSPRIFLCTLAVFQNSLVAWSGAS